VQLKRRDYVLGWSLQDVDADLNNLSIKISLTKAAVLRPVVNPHFSVAAASVGSKLIAKVLDASEDDSAFDTKQVIVNLVSLLLNVAVVARPHVHSKRVLQDALGKFDVDKSQWVPNRRKRGLAGANDVGQLRGPMNRVLACEPGR
jgi:hypothetical protein